MPGASDYTHALRALLPPGAAWGGENLRKLLGAWAAEFARADTRSATLLGEAVPDTASALLPDWEQLLGLSAAAGASEAERRRAVLALLLGRAAVSDAEQLAFARGLGWALAFAYYTPARVGAVRAGQRSYGADWAHARRITGSASARSAATATALRSALAQHQPAHAAWLWALN